MNKAGGAKRFLSDHPRAVRIEIAAAKGSTPREAGAWMLVALEATYGTIGGGQLELLAMDRAHEMIRADISRDSLDVPLGPEIGQCCGGRVTMDLWLVDDAIATECMREEERDLAARPHVYLFGAGHVGQALAEALSLLPLRVLIADPRREELDKIGTDAEKSLMPVPEQLIRAAPPGSAFVILTHEHALDFLLAAEALARDDAAYAGMIGSRTKLRTFRSWYLKNGGDEARFSRLITPIGGRSNDKRPQVIAAFVAAEIMQALSRHDGSGMTPDSSA